MDGHFLLSKVTKRVSDTLAFIASVKSGLIRPEVEDFVEVIQTLTGDIAVLTKRVRHLEELLDTYNELEKLIGADTRG